MRLGFFALLVVCSFGLSAQFGLAYLHNFNDAKLRNFPAQLGDPTIRYDNSSEIAAFYWFRLPKRRIEFQPTGYYAGQLSGSRYRANELGFQFKTNVYVFDLATDCNCPTFGKQGPQLQKGFFIQLSPGVNSHQFTGEARSTSFTIGGGVGLDVGVSNLLTLTPLASVRRTLSQLNTGFEYSDDTNTPIDGVTAHLTTFQLGLQVTFRLDKRHY